MLRNRPSSALLALGLLSLVWGYNWVVMKEALRFSGPFAFASLRCLLGALALAPVLWWRGRPLKPGSWVGASVLGLLQSTGFIGISIWALSAGSAGRTTVLAYTMPLWMLVLSLPILGERLRGFQWVAVCLALGGLACIVKPWGLHPQLLSIILAVGAGFLWALSGVWVKLMPRAHLGDLLTLNAWQLFLGGVPLFVIALAVESRWPEWTPRFIAALAYNVILGTALGWALWLYVLKKLPASIAGLNMLVIPVLGVIAAWLQLAEVPGVWEGLGMLLIIGGLTVLSFTQLEEGGKPMKTGDKPTRMTAIVLKRFGGVEHLQLSQIPVTDPQAGEVRVKVMAATINPVDFKVRQGRLGGDLPLVLGFDLAGVVDAVGPGVSELAVGDPVYGFVDPGGPASNGSYAEYVTLPASFVARKPRNFSFPQAAAVAMVGLTAYQCVRVKAGIKPGEAVFIAGGSGAVGSVAVQLARYGGADPILTTAGSDASAAYLTGELGLAPEHILSYRGLSLAEMKERLLQMNRGRPVQAAFDFVGADMKRLCLEAIDFDGRAVSIVEEPADFQLPIFSGPQSPLFVRSASFHFVLVLARARFAGPAYWQIFRQQLHELAELIEAGHLKPHRLIMLEEFSAAAVQRGHSELEGRHVDGKLILPVG
jgi:NADPH2:quinone reductase